MISQEVERVREDLTAGSRILVAHNVLDAFGHVSARHPKRPDRFIMSRRIAPGLVKETDFLEFDANGELSDKSDAAVFVERYIHSAIYRARPDVNSVVHSHSNAMITVGVVADFTLKPVCHMCGFLASGARVFEIRDAGGDGTDLLVSNPALGDALAQTLATANIVLMRGHGSTAVANSVPLAVYRAIYAETNARIQATATVLGPVIYLSDAEAQATDEINSLHVGRSWDFWKASLAARSGQMEA